MCIKSLADLMLLVAVTILSIIKLLGGQEDTNTEVTIYTVAITLLAFSA